MNKILFIDNTAHHLYGQLHHLNALRSAGYIVEVLVPDDGRYFNKLENLGFHCHNNITSWRGVNPVQELGLLLLLRRIIRKIQPNLICSFTIKPNLYAAIITRQLKIPIITNITGLGTLFMRKKLHARFAVALYRYAFKNVSQVFFQNSDDFKYIQQLNILNNETIVEVLPGSGVDLNGFPYIAIAKDSSVGVTFLYSGRLIRDKGIYELIKAFKIVKSKFPQVKLKFIGNYFPANPSAISPAQVQQWVSDGVIEYLGMVDNVVEVIAGIDCMILPSYREGMPRSLLEASSMGKPIITVDSIGCKDVIEDGVTGFLAKVKDVSTLADVMIKFIELPFDKKVEMGLNGRRKMEREFDQTIVVNKYLEVVNKLLRQSN
ncbi:MAG: glycosyltransferase family 4 protein [Burkholderiales bacterium]|nr:glycosyltransferase family 4 protein [Burkholderiales bacterium]